MSNSPPDSDQTLSLSGKNHHSTKTRPSSVFIFQRSLRFVWGNWLGVLRVGWPLLLTLEILEFISDQYFDFVSEMIQRRGVENLPLLVGTALLEFLVGLVFSAAWFLAVIPILDSFRGEALESPRFARNLRLHLNQFLIEETRVFASILGRIPFLILPAAYEYIRLSLVPYVVVLDRGYQLGHRDALEMSRVLSQKRWWLLLLAFIATTLLPYGLKVLIAGEGNIWLWQHPGRVLLAAVAQFFANLAGAMILFAIYKTLVADVYDPSPGDVSALDASFDERC